MWKQMFIWWNWTKVSGHRAQFDVITFIFDVTKHNSMEINLNLMKKTFKM